MERIMVKANALLDDEDKKKDKIKSRVIVEETEIEKPIAAELQHRIKIDRFTGGTIKTALFDSMPLWSNGNDKAVEIKMTINDYQEWEAGLLLLILKDLWNEDLPIGGEKNVGRGILKGWKAEIRWDGKKVTKVTIKEKEKENGLDISPSDLINDLNRFCNALQCEIQN